MSSAISVIAARLVFVAVDVMILILASRGSLRMLSCLMKGIAWLHILPV